MRLVMLEHRTEWEPVIEMQGDGSIYSLKKGERKFFGRVSNDALVDMHEVPSFTCIHREISVAASTLKAHYDQDDTYVDDHTRISIADDGTVTVTLGTHPQESHGLRVEGPVAKARRTAALLVIAAIAQ
jgi:hypothetical protein